MPVLPTTDQVTALAPDGGSLQAGRGLAKPRRGQTVDIDEAALVERC